MPVLGAEGLEWDEMRKVITFLPVEYFVRMEFNRVSWPTPCAASGCRIAPYTICHISVVPKPGTPILEM